MTALSTTMLLLWPHAAHAESPDGSSCTLSSTPPSHHRRALGYGKGKESKALREAEEQARSSLLAATTAGFSDVRRDAVAAHIGITDTHYAGRQACAAADVEQRWVEGLDADAQQYDASVQALAAVIAEKLGGGLLQLEGPTWAGSGCVAAIGPTLTTALRSALGNHSVQLVAKGHSKPETPRLRLSLAAETAGVRLSPVLNNPAAGIDTPLAGFQFPLDLFNTTRDEAGTCTSDATLGLQDGGRAGSVKVTLDLPTQDGFVCEGDSLSPVLYTSAPVYAQVFSVYGDEALAVWSGTVNEEQSLGALTALRISEHDEKLVVVAAASKAELETLAGLDGFCRVAGGLTPALYPMNAAVDSETFTIWAAGTMGCSEMADREAQVQQTQDALAGVPRCAL